MERRRFTRVEFQYEAIIEADSWSTRGRIEDLSLQGIRVATPHGEAGDLVKVTVVLSEPHELSFRVPGVVVRADAAWLAVRFDLSGIDVGTLTHLRYLVGTEMGDLDEALAEYSRWLDEQD